jgi:xylulokinase
MSLLGIDAGTTGCKAAVFTVDGRLLASAYEEYDIQHPRPGWAELDAQNVWEKVKRLIQQVAAATDHSDPITALSVSSLGEAVIPVSEDGLPLASSILNFDIRGEEYVEKLAQSIPASRLYEINGNTVGNHYSLTKLMWIKEHQPDLYERAWQFLHWSGFISLSLGAIPTVDFSLANRTLLFDIGRQEWSSELLEWAGLDRYHIPNPVPSGTHIGQVNPNLAEELGLPKRVAIISGAHDQCANATGCGVINEGQAVYGMGTFICITPVFKQRRDPDLMIARGINTEHHAVPGGYVCFIYNQGGSLIKWFRNTFAAAEHSAAYQIREDVYDRLFAEIPVDPTNIYVLPHFTLTGPPSFIGDSCGVIVGLKLETTRGEILKGIIESTAYYLKECVDSLPPTGIAINDFRAVGGGSKSDAWIQVCANIFGRPFVRPRVTEAGALGAAIIAGAGCGEFSSISEGVNAMVKIERTFEPDLHQQEIYKSHYESYRQIWPLMANYLRNITKMNT